MSIEENLSSIATSLRDISVSLASIANHLTKPQVIYKAGPLSEDAPAPIATVTVTEGKAAPKSDQAGTGAPAATPAAAPATAGTVPYGDIQKAVLTIMAQQGKDKGATLVREVLAGFNLTTAKDAKPEQFAAILAGLMKHVTA